MNVILISGDANLAQLFREVLTELAGDAWHLSSASVEGCPPDADLYIWDDPPTNGLPESLDQRLSKHLFLVHRNDVAKFHQNLGGAEVTTLLKPVSRASLSAFLGLAASALRDRISAAQTLRADRDEVLQCLIDSNLKLQEYDQDRTNFLTRAIHDFRAPLTAAGGYCGLLLSDALGPLGGDQREVLQRMQLSIKRLSRMASAMFELSAGLHVKRQMPLEPGDIRECVEQAIQEITPFADSKRILISVDLDPEPGSLYLAPGQIEQVLINLLDNACKFTPKSGEIEIQGYPFFWERRSFRTGMVPIRDRRHIDSRKPNSYRVDVRDSGPTIQREHLEDIFEEYTSCVGGQDRSGGGLSLAICRMIVTLHEGRVWAENTESGPRFSFVLPAHRAEVGHSDPQQETITDYSEVS